MPILSLIVSTVKIYYSTDGSTPSELPNVYSNTLKFFSS
ncbi:MAG: chitobiase/beta-hexosaminidase C-terminal domain-containing protein [Ignavibacteriales bacterium]|nr:chitobiase/beta-hexosaminidase C-terminal domain-containing protein [Ignavibacteriales bacterium]